MGSGTRLERYGMRFLKTQSKSVDTDVHILTREEQTALRNIQRLAVMRAAFAGACSAAVSGVASVIATREATSAWGYWLIVGTTTAVASVVEIGFLYFDGLRSVREMAAHAGLEIDPAEAEEDLALALCRAALELPSPPDNALGVDPLREVTKLRALLLSLLYKAKIALTSFILKVLVRRALGRAALKSALEFISVPVTAAWNAVVTHWVLEEARLRILGPSAARELVLWTAPTDELRPMLVDAAACVMVKARSVHPNVDLLARLFLAEVATPPELGGLADFLTRLSALDTPSTCMVLRALCATAIVDGRLSRSERALLRSAFQAAGREVPWQEIEALRYHMVKGDGLRLDLLRDVHVKIARETEPVDVL